MKFNFWRTSAVGLDIADTSLEAAELIKGPRQIKVRSLSRQGLSAGVVERGVIKDTAKLAAAVRSLLAAAKPLPIRAKKIYFGLPDSQVYLYSFSVPELPKSNKELNDLVWRAASENVPLNPDELAISFQAFRAGTAGQIVVAAISRAVLTQWQIFFSVVGLGSGV